MNPNERNKQKSAQNPKNSKKVCTTKGADETKSFQEKVLKNLSDMVTRLSKMEKEIAEVRESTTKISDINTKFDVMQRDIAEIRVNIADSRTQKETIIGSANRIKMVRLGLPASNVNELNSLETALQNGDQFDNIMSLFL